MTKREIERRWLLEGMPMELNALQPSRIVQVYESIGEAGSVRYRKTEMGGHVTYVRTEKTNVARGECDEDERECGADDFNMAFISGGPYVIKDRYHYPWGGYTFEIDLFDVPADHAQAIAGQPRLVIMEVELPAIDTAIQLPRLSVGALEITGMKQYSNAQLAVMFAELRSQ